MGLVMCELGTVIVLALALFAVLLINDVFSSVNCMYIINKELL